MKVDFEIDTLQIRTEEIRKSLSDYNDPATIAVKLSLIKGEIENLTDTQRLFNKFLVYDE
tara:strand:- start:245 stop:424 length:180 start_codon:yes stop_codon:yes gene_type:complete